MDDHVQDVLPFLPKVFGRKVRKIVMDKSYRNTVEIATYAAAIHGSEVPGLLERHGKEVEEKSFDSLDRLLDEVERCLRLQGEDGFETAAVLAMTEEEAWDISRLLEKRGVETSYIDRDSSSFKPGLTVTTFYLAKGLEFDQVFTVWDSKKENPLLTQAKYICATRALHELYMFEEK